MKELEKTKRISISAVLFLLVILIAVLTFKKPTYVFANNSETTLNEIVSNNYIITLEQLKAMDTDQYILVDIRSNFEYAKGHLDSAVNISTHQILESNNIDFFDNLKNNNKIASLYGKNPEEVNSAWMLLYQLGYNNVKILCIETNYIDNQFEVKNYSLEKPSLNYAQTMKAAKKTTTIADTKSNDTKIEAPKKVIITKKKKKRVPEGGC